MIFLLSSELKAVLAVGMEGFKHNENPSGSMSMSNFWQKDCSERSSSVLKAG